MKVVYMIRRGFDSSRVNPLLMLKLFDTCVRPILLYAAELWSVFHIKCNGLGASTDPYYLEKAFNKFLPEDIHTKYCKFVLGVNRYASNVAAKGELGRYPMAMFAILQAIKFWIHINDPLRNVNSTLSYEALTHVDSYHPASFDNHIRSVLHFFSLDHVYENKSCTTMSVNSLITTLKSKLMSRYATYFFDMIAGKVVGNDSSNKLRTYMTFKKEYKMENYVLVDVDKHIVSNFARLRISNHILEIERGRYRNIPADKRFCTICSIPNNHVEDEVHFMCECELYKAERCILFDNIELFVP